jgi:hypothetical protein
MHKITAAILAAIATLRGVALKVRARLIDAHVANLSKLEDKAKAEVSLAQEAKTRALDLYTFACKEIAEADAKVREVQLFVKEEAAKHGVTL